VQFPIVEFEDFMLKLYLHEDATFLNLINLLPSQQKSYMADNLMRMILYIGVA
jgi:hypothetical protein